jgi:hypothetical protein
MERRHFIKAVGFSSLSLAVLKPSFGNNQLLLSEYAYDHEPCIWGSPYRGDTQSVLDFRHSTFEQIQKELAHFKMSEMPRDLFLFDINLF